MIFRYVKHITKNRHWNIVKFQEKEKSVPFSVSNKKLKKLVLVNVPLKEVKRIERKENITLIGSNMNSTVTEGQKKVNFQYFDDFLTNILKIGTGNVGLYV